MVIVADGLGKHFKKALWVALYLRAFYRYNSAGEDATQIARIADAFFVEFEKRFPDDIQTTKA